MKSPVLSVTEIHPVRAALIVLTDGPTDEGHDEANSTLRDYVNVRAIM